MVGVPGGDDGGCAGHTITRLSILEHCMDTETQNRPDVALALDELRVGAPAPWKRWVKWAVLALIAAAVAYFFFGQKLH